MAVEERDLRFARHTLEILIERRATTVAIASALGMKRREVSAVTGLSMGRIQQVVDDASPIVRREVERAVQDILHVLREVGHRSVWRDAINLPAERDATLIDELIEFELLIEDDAGVRQTDAGGEVELHLRSGKSKAGGGRA
jgi:predicted methyltransferase